MFENMDYMFSVDNDTELKKLKKIRSDGKRFLTTTEKGRIKQLFSLKLRSYQKYGME